MTLIAGNGGTEGIDQADAVVVEPAGDVIAAGVLSLNRYASPLYVVKVAGPTGKRLWAVEFDGVHGPPDLPGVCGNDRTRLALDPGGDVLVQTDRVCAPGGSFFEGLAVVKLSSATGGVQWVARPTTIKGHWTSIGTTSNGTVVVAGTLDPVILHNFDREFVVQAFSGASGAPIWERRMSGADSGDPFPDVSATGSIVVDGSDDVIATGVIEEADGTRIFVTKFDGATGADLWAAPIVLAVDDGIGASAQVDGNDDVVVTVGSVSLGNRVVKLSGVDGSELWAVSRGNYSDLRVDSAGDILLGGQAFVTKLDGSSGMEIWNSTGLESTLSVRTIDGSGAIVMGGPVDDGNDGEDFLIEKLDPSTGAVVASYRIDNNNSSFGETAVTGLAVGPDGAIVSAGSLANRRGVANFAVVGFSERLAGERLLVRDGTAESLRVTIRDPHVVTTVSGSAGDPTVAGAMLTLRNPTTLESASMALPASNWISRPGSKTYKYRDAARSDGPCTRVDLQDGKFLKIACLGLGGFSLDEPSQGTLAIRLSIGTPGATYCAQFEGLDDGPGRFVSAESSPPDDCG